MVHNWAGWNHLKRRVCEVVRSTTIYKLSCIIVVFPLLYLMIAFDSLLRKKHIRNPFLEIPRDTAELMKFKGRFFALLKSKCRDQLGIPSDAALIYLDVKTGSSTEEGKNEGVACVEIAFRSSCRMSGEDTYYRFKKRIQLPSGEIVESTVLRLFVKMATVRKWPIWFKALVATFTANTKEVDVFTKLLPLLDDYCKGRGLFSTKCMMPAPPRDLLSSQAGEMLPLAYPQIGGISVPTCRFVTWNRLFDRSLTIFDCVDTSVWRPIPDHCVVTETCMFALTRSIARFHALTVGRVGDYAFKYNPQMLTSSTNDALIASEVRKWVPDGSATGWLQSILDAFNHKMDDMRAVKTYCGSYEVDQGVADLTDAQFEAMNDGKFLRRFWVALKKSLEREVTCISHCDCRPGNKLFCGGGGGLPLRDVDSTEWPINRARDSFPDEDDVNALRYSKSFATVVHLDWEACSLAPLLYDLSYFVAGRPERKRYETVLLREYLDVLRLSVEQRMDRDEISEMSVRQRVLENCVPTFEKATNLLKIAYFTQAYFSWALQQFGGIGVAQGNSSADAEVWTARSRDLFSSITADPDAVVTLIGNGLRRTDVLLFRYFMLRQRY